jgi:hypothetical protein
MIKRILIVVVFLTSLNAQATHWLTYYIYLETEYIQGPWQRIDILEESNYKYLAPKAYENLFGSIPNDMVKTMIENLRENKPNIYNWNYEIDVHGDSVILIVNDKIAHYVTIKNEITATLTLNGFSGVTFRTPNQVETMTLDDLTLPYFDLIIAEKRVQKDLDTIVNIGKKEIKDRDGNNSTKSPWLAISIGFNILLIGWLLFNRIKK